MKKIVTIGILVLTLTVNLAPLNVQAAGVSQYYQCNGGNNAVTIRSGNCNLNDIQSKLQELGINENCLNKSVQPEQCNTNVAVANNSASKNCKTNQSVQKVVVDAKQQLPDAVKAKVENKKANNTQNCNTATNSNTANCNIKSTNTTSTKPATNTTSTKPASTNTASTKLASTNTTSTKPETNTTSTKPASANTASTKPASTITTNTNTTDNSTKITSNNTTSTSIKNTDNNSNANVSYAQQVVNLVNVERAKEGLAALTVDQNVQNAAMIRASEIQSKFEHVRPNGSSFSTVLKESGVTYRGAGENIAWGQKTPEEVVTAWMNSPGHRANIMNKNFVQIGVGNIQNSAGTQYWVQLFTY